MRLSAGDFTYVLRLISEDRETPEAYKREVFGKIEQMRDAARESQEASRNRKGYKYSTITAIEPQDDTVLISLSCGHSIRCHPYGEHGTAEEYAKHLQRDGHSPYVIGQTRIYCERFYPKPRVALRKSAQPLR